MPLSGRGPTPTTSASVGKARGNAERVGDQELVALGDAGDAGGDVYGGAYVVALAVEERAMVRTDPHRGEMVLGRDRFGNFDAARDGVGRIREDEHELVADLFHHLAVVVGERFANEVGEALHDLCRDGVTHRFGE